MFKNALVSTSNKDGLVEFLRPFVAGGMRVVSTGGTSKYLRENGIEVVEVAAQTGFPEVMDGRVRTLHPNIHMPLLARAGVAEDMHLLKTHGLEPFDLVVVNLYPFEEAAAKNLPDDELIEFIDIGGPSLLRAAAKNHERIAVVCEPEDYSWIAERKELNLPERRKLAARVYAHTSRYDALIARTLDPENVENRFLAGKLVQPLRYGENPQQSAAWFRADRRGLHQAKVLHGKPLSYNNILDLEAACSTVREFTEPCAVAVKHNNPCGVGIGVGVSSSASAGGVAGNVATDVALATLRAIQADPVSVFGGIVALNRPVDLATADELAKIFLECVIAPSFSAEALQKLAKKKDLRLLEWPDLGLPYHATSDSDYEFRTVRGGYLLQRSDRVLTWPEGEGAWQILGDTPSARTRSDIALAWKTCAHLKSNAIALASDGRTVGLGMGQVNRVDAVEQAIARLQKHHAKASDVVLASDAFFPFPDSVELAAQAGIRWIVQPGGSIRDDQVLLRAKELHVNVILTKIRHFRH